MKREMTIYKAIYKKNEIINPMGARKNYMLSGCGFEPCINSALSCFKDKALYKYCYYGYDKTFLRDFLVILKRTLQNC